VVYNHLIIRNHNPYALQNACNEKGKDGWKVVSVFQDGDGVAAMMVKEGKIKV